MGGGVHDEVHEQVKVMLLSPVVSSQVTPDGPLWRPWKLECSGSVRV